MFFGALPPIEAEGGVLAHRVLGEGVSLRKGHLLTAHDCQALMAAGIASVTIARLEAGDVAEDEAATRVAQKAAAHGVRIDPAFTGRANFFAAHDGILRLDRMSIDAFNIIDEGLTLATLPDYRRVVAGEMIGTVKIIPFAIAGHLLAAGLGALGGAGVVTVRPFAPLRVAMIQLTDASVKLATLDKTRDITARRLAALGGMLALETRVPHVAAALVSALQALPRTEFDLLVVFGAAAITDRRDVIPAAIEVAGGRIEHLGMPVDPGNLLLLAEFAGKPLIGAPGCARAPAENGFDWVLERLFAGIPVRRADIQAMGVGGLLMEIVSRPQPRDGGKSLP
jgi:molybdenum cofactor cytidylyltransferase